MDNLDHRVCCFFRTRTWTTLVATVQIVFHSAGLILSAWALAALLRMGKKRFNSAVEHGLIPHVTQEDGITYFRAVNNLIVLVCIFVSGAVLGIILCVATLKKNIRYLILWIPFSLCSCFWTMCLTFLNMSQLTLTFLVIFILLNAVGVHVVLHLTGILWREPRDKVTSEIYDEELLLQPQVQGCCQGQGQGQEGSMKVGGKLGTEGRPNSVYSFETLIFLNRPRIWAKFVSLVQNVVNTVYPRTFSTCFSFDWLTPSSLTGTGTGTRNNGPVNPAVNCKTQLLGKNPQLPKYTLPTTTTAGNNCSNNSSSTVNCLNLN